MESVIEKVELQFLSAEQTAKLRIIPLEDTEKHYLKIIRIIKDITEAVKDPKIAYNFLKANGLARIVAPNLTNQYPEVTTKLIMLLKVLFDVAPITTNSIIPTKILDVLLDIFEIDDNLALKAHVLDVLAKWMPDNPKIQTRVMKLKGLEPFYNQINKLDASGIKILLDLFNRILNEHLTVKNAKQLNKFDGEKFIMYQRIGLVERMSTPNVCNGLLNIVEILWSFNNNDNHEIVEAIFNLIKNIRPFCMKIYMGRSKALGLFEALLTYVKDENKKEIFDKFDANITDFQEVVEKCVSSLKNYKDEL